jgi:hypothetical protein
MAVTMKISEARCQGSNKEIWTRFMAVTMKISEARCQGSNKEIWTRF